MTTLRDVLAVLDGAYDPAWAEGWDAVGLVCGSLDAPVTRVHVAVDPVQAVADEALAAGADLLLTHHPLWLRGVHGVDERTPGGRLVGGLIRGGCALVAAHTNADVARPGVNDALLSALGISHGDVLVAGATVELDALVVHVPSADRERVLDALHDAGAGRLGDYDRCGFWSTGSGTFRPLEGATPTIGSVGAQEVVAEDRLELVVPRGARAAVVAALATAHPYETPSWQLWPLEVPADRGLGRVGDLPAPLSLAELAEAVASSLPATVGGVRWSGPASARVQRVAVCGGSGSDLTAAARRAGADVLVTADTRHHTGLDAALPIIDVSHWASEWPWCAQAAALLVEALGVTASVSTIVTDPWTGHVSTGGIH